MSEANPTPKVVVLSEPATIEEIREGVIALRYDIANQAVRAALIEAAQLALELDLRSLSIRLAQAKKEARRAA